MKDQEKICREEWFKDHVAKVIGIQGDPPYRPGVIEWKRPTSWNYGCHFIIHSQWLCVVGDLGEATYQWNESIDMQFLGSLNFDYFAGKCRASPSGRQFRTWSTDKAVSELQAECARDPKRKYAYHDLIDHACEQESLMFALHRAHNDGSLGDIDTETLSHLAGSGYIPDPMCVGHFVGLQMAIKQLTNPATTVTPT